MRIVNSSAVLMALCVGSVFGAEAAAEIVTLAEPAATALPLWWQMRGSPAVATLLASVAVWLLKWRHDTAGLDTDRWVGLVYNLYGAAEKAGALDGWSGTRKLAEAMEAFGQQYRQTFGHYPTEHDEQDMRNDLARLAVGSKARTPMVPPAL